MGNKLLLSHWMKAVATLPRIGFPLAKTGVALSWTININFFPTFKKLFLLYFAQLFSYFFMFFKAHLVTEALQVY